MSEEAFRMIIDLSGAFLLVSVSRGIRHTVQPILNEWIKSELVPSPMNKRGVAFVVHVFHLLKSVVNFEEIENNCGGRSFKQCWENTNFGQVVMAFGCDLVITTPPEHDITESFQIYLYSNIGEMTVEKVNEEVMRLLLSNLKGGEGSDYTMIGYTSIDDIPDEPAWAQHGWSHDGVLVRTQVVTPASDCKGYYGKGYAGTNFILDRRFVNLGMADMSTRVWIEPLRPAEGPTLALA